MLTYEETKRKWLAKLNNIGINVEDFNPEIEKYIKQKGFSRYLSFAHELISLKDSNSEIWKLPEHISITEINVLYIADITARRESARIIKPIEIMLRSAIINECLQFEDELYSMNALEFIKKIEFLMINSTKFNSLYFDKKPSREVTILLSNMAFVLRKIAKIESETLNYKQTFTEFIEDAELGIITAVFAIFFVTDNFDPMRWFEHAQKIEVVSFKSLNNYLGIIRDVRNAAAHHNVLFHNRPLSSKDVDVILNELLEAINFFFGGQGKAISSFVKNWFLHYESHNFQSVQEYIEKLYPSWLHIKNKPI